MANTTATEGTEHVLGEDYPALLAAADASLGEDAVREAADRIVAAYRVLVTDPATQPETETVVALRHVRAALPEVARELVDAALRFLDTTPEGFPPAEITCVDEPTPTDLAAAVLIAVPDDAVYLAGAIALDLDGTW